MSLSFLERIKIGKKEAFFLLLVFLLGFGIRAQNIQPNYEYFFGFDSYYHARMTSYIIQDGAIPDRDPLAYYQLGYAALPATGPFFWYFSAALYKIGTLGAAYDKETWIFFVKLLPALFGALTAAAMFFFGKELYGKKAGYATAVVAAVVPSFVYRTMAGFFEEDSLGFLWLAIGFVFFLRSLKEFKVNARSLANAVLGGVFFGIMAFTWEFYLIVPVVIGFSFPFMLLNVWGKKERKETGAFLVNFAVTTAVFTVLTFIQDGASWIFRGTKYIVNSLPLGATAGGTMGAALVIVGAFAVLIFGIFLFLMLAGGKSAHGKKTRSRIPLLASMVVLYVALLALSIAIIDPQVTDPETGVKEGIFTSKFTEKSVLGSTIGEESLGNPTFGYKYNALIFLPVIALVAIPAWLYFSRKDFLSPIVFWWVWITLVMAWYKLKFTYVFGLPIAASAGFVAAVLFFYFKDREQAETKVVVLALAFILFTGVAAGSYFVSKRPPSIETSPAWKEAMHWIRDNTPEDSKLFNWWSYGHWLAFVTERQVSLDNRNWSLDGDANYAQFILENDVNKALPIIREFGSDYIIIESGELAGQHSMLIYAKLKVDYGPAKPENRPYFFTISYGEGVSQFVPGFLQLPCVKQAGTYNCSGLQFSEEQMRSYLTGWQPEPNITIDSDDTAAAYANGPDFSSLLLFSPGANKSMVTRLWLGDPSLDQYFEEVFANGVVKIFRVKESVFQ